MTVTVATESHLTVGRDALRQSGGNKKQAFTSIKARAKTDSGLTAKLLEMGIWQLLRNVEHSTRAPTRFEESEYHPPVVSLEDVDPEILAKQYEYRLHGSGIAIGLGNLQDILDSMQEIDRNRNGLSRHWRYQEKVARSLRQRPEKVLVMEAISAERLQEFWEESE